MRYSRGSISSASPEPRRAPGTMSLLSWRSSGAVLKSLRCRPQENSAREPKGMVLFQILLQVAEIPLCVRIVCVAEPVERAEAGNPRSVAPGARPSSYARLVHREFKHLPACHPVVLTGLADAPHLDQANSVEARMELSQPHTSWGLLNRRGTEYTFP